MHDAKCLDELWVGVKGQSNLVIAGSPRNSYRASLIRSLRGVEQLIGLGARMGYQTFSNSEYPWDFMGVRLRGISSVVERERAQIVS